MISYFWIKKFPVCTFTAILAALRFCAATPVCRVAPADDRELTPEWAYDPVRATLATGTPKIPAGSSGSEGSLFALIFLSCSFAGSPWLGVRLVMSVQL